jgi:Amt family ammonium transporter
MIGTGILWFGWFGFNAGSELAVDGHTLQAFIATFVAAAAGGLAWVVVERVRDGHPTNLGAASGIVAGLVAITPACAFVTPVAAIAIGIIAGTACCFAVSAKTVLGFDDALDVVGVHMVGGLVGSLLIGVFSDPVASGWKVGRGSGMAMKGLTAGGGPRLLGEQLLANGVTMIYSFVITFAIWKVLDAVMTIRVDEETERQGLDIAEHAETAYNYVDRSIGRPISRSES